MRTRPGSAGWDSNGSARPVGVRETTLLRLIAGFEHANAGTIWVRGTQVAAPGTHLPPHKRGVGIVAQDGALFPRLDVAANVGFGLPRGERHAGRVQELLQLVGLHGLDRRFPHELSGGEQQRVALARALAPAPGLILLDEPFSALDPTLRAGLRADVRHALQLAGTTALVVTHDQTEALSIADQVGVMRAGRLVQVSEPATLYRRPVDADVARFVGDAVLLSGELHDGCVCSALGRLPVYSGALRSGPVTVLIRPEQVLLNAEPGGVEARVLGVTYQRTRRNRAPGSFGGERTRTPGSYGWIRSADSWRSGDAHCAWRSGGLWARPDETLYPLIQKVSPR